MGPKTYKKIPLIVEAMQLRIDTAGEVLDWLAEHNVQFMLDYDIYKHPIIKIPSSDGINVLMEHDWLLRGAAGDFYVCSNKRFKYEYVFFNYPEGE